jgi:small-conductance mechanosensitive channel
MLNDIRDQLDSWRSALFKFNSDLVNMNAEMGAFSRDSVIRQLITDSIYRQMYLDELSQLREKWDKARDSTRVHLIHINQLQSSMTRPYFFTVDLLNQVDRQKKALTDKLFAKEYPFIWEGQRNDNRGILAVRTLRSQKGILGYFLLHYWAYYLYMVLIGLLFFFWVYRSYHIIRQSQDKESLLRDLHVQYLRPRPFLGSLVVMLNVLPFFNLNAPPVLSQWGQFILLIVVSVFFWRTWPRPYFRYWSFILVLYILFLVTGTVFIPDVYARLWLLALNAGSLALAWHPLRRIIRVVAYPRMVKIVWWVYLVLNVLAILMNTFGRVSLAKIFSTSAIYALVQVIVLSVFVDSLVEALSLQTAAGRTREKTKNLVPVLEKMRKGFLRMLLLFAGFTWLLAFSVNMNFYDPLYDWFIRAMEHTLKIGSISFKVRNVLLFIGIVYLSNVLQKYIGYLYGSTDERSMPQTGRKGSRLVMIRLILIIAGFLLAIAASGLPIDRITIVLGALGVGIGLGLQNIVNNLVSGVILIFERPFQIGDYIELNGKKGIVRDIGIRSSKLVTETGTEIIMPNGDLLSGEVINWTVQNSQVRIEIPVNIEAGHTFDEITQLVQEALEKHPDLSQDDKPRVLLNTATEKVMSVTILVYIHNISQIQTVKSEVMRVLYQHFKEHGIKIA